MSGHGDVIREALDLLAEAAKGWPDDNPYERAVAPALAALEALERELAERVSREFAIALAAANAEPCPECGYREITRVRAAS